MDKFKNCHGIKHMSIGDKKLHANSTVVYVSELQATSYAIRMTYELESFCMKTLVSSLEVLVHLSTQFNKKTCNGFCECQ